MLAVGATSKYFSSAMNASGINNFIRIPFVFEICVLHLILFSEILEIRFRIENAKKININSGHAWTLFRRTVYNVSFNQNSIASPQTNIDTRFDSIAMRKEERKPIL